MIFFVDFLLGWPILTAIVLFILITALLGTEHEIIGTFVVLLSLAALGYAFYVKDFTIAWGTVFWYALGYLGIGALFIRPKWTMWSRKMGRKFQEKLKSYNEKAAKRKETIHNNAIAILEYGYKGTYNALQKNPADPRVTIEDRNRLTEAIENAKISATNEYDRTNPAFERQWNDNHSKSVMMVKPLADGTWEVFYDKTVLGAYITAWIIYWPFYGIVLLFEDFFVEIGIWIAEHVGKAFARIATREFNSGLMSQATSDESTAVVAK